MKHGQEMTKRKAKGTPLSGSDVCEKAGDNMKYYVGNNQPHPKIKDAISHPRKPNEVVHELPVHRQKRAAMKSGIGSDKV